MSSFPPIPPSIKGIAHYLKIADEHEKRNMVISYWARMYACQLVMKTMPGKKPPEVSDLLLALLDWLEQTKKSHHDTEGITDETTANAIIEQYVLQLFAYADAQDRAANFDKNVVKAFYTAGILMDVLEQFGDLSDDIVSKRKYAKWKAAYIHNCLKNGEIPQSGGPDEILDDNENAEEPSSTVVDPPSVIEPQSPQVPTTNTLDDPIAPAPASSPITPLVPPADPVPFTSAPEPFFPTPFIPGSVPTTPSSTVSSGLGPDVIQKAQKHCKYATSALNYDDVKTAIDNLSKALNLLQFGREN